MYLNYSNYSEYSSKFHWGTFIWNFIHTITVIDGVNVEGLKATGRHVISKLKALEHVIPCDKCIPTYRSHLLLLDYLDLSKPMVLFYWGIDLHNAVNRKLRKREWTYPEALRHWTNK